MVKHQTDNILQYSAAAVKSEDPVQSKHRENFSQAKENKKEEETLSQFKEGENFTWTKENRQEGEISKTPDWRQVKDGRGTRRFSAEFSPG